MQFRISSILIRNSNRYAKAETLLVKLYAINETTEGNVDFSVEVVLDASLTKDKTITEIEAMATSRISKFVPQNAIDV
jgi:hypothetical protein